MGRSARRKAELMHNRETMLQTYRELFEFSAAEAARSLPVVQ
jgi:hypothetical protein